MFRKSLDYIGYKDARVVVVFGSDTIAPIPREWERHLDGVEGHWIEPTDYCTGGYAVQGMARYRYIRPDADVAFMCDADTLMVRPVDDLIRRLVAEPALAGVPCLRSPPHPVRFPENPFYVNYGFLAGTPQILARLYEASVKVRARLSSYSDPFWIPQISIPIAVHQAGIPTMTLPLRYNFQNDGAVDAAYPDELVDVRVIHYMNTGQYDRSRIFCDPDAFYGFMGQRFHESSSRTLQTHVRRLTDGMYPFVA